MNEADDESPRSQASVDAERNFEIGLSESRQGTEHIESAWRSIAEAFPCNNVKH